jgi:hypothetical protein
MMPSYTHTSGGNEMNMLTIEIPNFKLRITTRTLLEGLLAISLVLLALAIQPVQAQDDHAHGAGEGELSEEIWALLSEVRGATAKYQDVDVALEEGYGEFLSCFKYGDESGMGQHYVNGELVADDVVDPLQPESVIYQPYEDGTMALVGFEYLIFAEAWDPENTGREAPQLFGQQFHLATNIPNTPPVWAFHLWLWAHNPNGLFADYNPSVFCLDDQPSVDMSQQ